MAGQHPVAGGEAYDWSVIDLFMDIRAAPKIVYDAWATAAGMRSFFARDFAYLDGAGKRRASTETALAGDAYELEFHHPLQLRGKVLQAEPPRRFVFSFPTVMTVRIELTPRSDGTRLHLHQGGISTDEEARVDQHLNCRSCWVYYLMNLKSVLEHGIDLRDDDPLPDNIVSVHFGNLMHEET